MHYFKYEKVAKELADSLYIDKSEKQRVISIVERVYQEGLLDGKAEAENGEDN